MSPGASGSGCGVWGGSGGGGGSGAGAGGAVVAGRAVVVAPDRALHPASAIRTRIDEKASKERIAPHPIAVPPALPRQKTAHRPAPPASSPGGGLKTGRLTPTGPANAGSRRPPELLQPPSPRRRNARPGPACGYSIGLPPPGRGQHSRSDPADFVPRVEQQAGAGRVPVFHAKGQQVPGVPESGTRRALDLDRQEPPVRLNDEVDLRTRGRAPMEDLGTAEPAVAPRQQIVEDDVLEVGALRFRIPRQVKRQPSVCPIELRGLDEPFRAVGGVRRKPDQQVRRLQQVQVAADGLLGKGRVAPQLGLVDQSSEPHGGRAHHPPEIGQRGDPRLGLEVAFQIGADIPVKPPSTRRVGLAHQRGHRKASPPRERTPVFRFAGLLRDGRGPLRIGDPQEIRPPSARSESTLFPAGHGPQREIARPASQRFGNPPHQQEVGRPRQQEPARRPGRVHGPLHRGKDSRNPLHLVQDHRLGAEQQPFRIALSRLHDVQIVEGEIPARTRREFAPERCLPGLPRAGDDDRGRLAEVCQKRLPDGSRQGMVHFYLGDNHAVYT